MIKAVGFDIDGTLYPSTSLYLRMVPKTIGHLIFLLRYNWLRTQLRNDSFVRRYGFDTVSSIQEFHEKEAETLAKHFGGNFDTIYEIMETCIYQKSETMFKHIKLFNGVETLLQTLQERGIPTGALSDFPAETKLEYLSIKNYFNVIMTSEATGKLKPFSESFIRFSEAVGVAPEHILYVGNSEKYDVLGAKTAGMQTALIKRSWKRSQADFVFSSYKELENYIVTHL